MKTASRPLIGITMGDPVGIGPEIIVKALGEPAVWEVCSPLILGDPGVMEKVLTLLSSPLRVKSVMEFHQETQTERAVNLLPLSQLKEGQFSYGKPNRETGSAMVTYIKEAVRLSLQGRLAGMVTCPINKAAMALAGYTYPGHTELLAEETSTKEYAMMLAGERLKVVLVTIHISLQEVPGALSPHKIDVCIRLTHDSLKKFFGIKKPKIAVAALNPHAGEEGLFGKEEARMIAPAVQKASVAGINVFGPFPPDTLFYYAAKGDFDAVVCMYHDQGLIPLKLLHFEDAVNVTLGLPIIRTSVDHGTAYDIAGTGKANPKSLINAIRMAAQMANF